MLTISRREVEQRVLRALREKPLRKDFFEEFCREFAKETNRLRMEQRAGVTAAKLRGPIDSIVLMPDEDQPPSRDGDDTRSGEPRLRVELWGNLAAMLGAAGRRGGLWAPILENELKAEYQEFPAGAQSRPRRQRWPA